MNKAKVYARVTISTCRRAAGPVSEFGGFAGLAAAAWSIHEVAGIVAASLVLIWYGNRPRPRR